MTTTDHTRAALLRMDVNARRQLSIAMRDKVNEDPDEHHTMTPLWFALYAEIVDIDYDESQVLKELEKALRL